MFCLFLQHIQRHKYPDYLCILRVAFSLSVQVNALGLLFNTKQKMSIFTLSILKINLLCGVV